MKKMAIVLGALLVLCTFAARPLRALTTTRVTWATVRNRRLEYTETIQADCWYTDEQTVCSIPYRLPGALTVKAVYVSNMDMVTKGEPILAFDATSGEWALAQAEQALLEAQVSYDTFAEEIADEILRLREELYNSDKDMRALRGDELAVAEEKYARKQEKLEALQAGDSNQLLLESLRLEDARQVLSQLVLLQRQDWILVSPEDGFVQDVRASIGTDYSGLDPLLVVCAPSSQMALLAPVGQRWVDLQHTTGVNVRIYRGNLEREAQWDGEERRDDTTYARLLLTDEEAGEMVGVCSVEINAISSSMSCLVPEKALSEDRQSVFVLRERQGYFGREYYVEEQKVVLGDTNGTFVQVTRGLQAGDRVILDSDRPLMDGDEVRLPYADG